MNMAILVDGANWPWRGRMWCHLVSDTSLDELHEFARAHEIPERAFGGDHYDVPEDARPTLIAAGARSVSSQDIVRALYGAGIRQRPNHSKRDVTR